MEFRHRLLGFWALSAVLFVLGWTFRPAPVATVESGTPPSSYAECPKYGEAPPSASLPGKLADRVLLRNEDSWRAMRAAVDELRQGGDRPLYESIFERCIKFQYPPSSVLAIAGLSALGPAFTANAFLNALSFCFLGLLAYCVLRLYSRQFPTGTMREKLTPLLFVVTCYPVLKSIELGQIQTWLNGMFAFAVLAFVSGRAGWAGVAIGLMATIKPQMALFLPWALLRRDWALAKGIAGSAAVVLLITLLAYGISPQLEYLGVLSSISKHGESYFANQSFNGLALRALKLGPNIYFDHALFAPYHPFVRYGTLVTSLALIGYALFAGVRLGAPRAGLAFCIAAACFTIASPVAWEHHYGILPPIFAVALCSLAEARGSRALFVALGAAWLLTAVRYAATHALYATWLNFLQSYVYFGMLILLGVLHVLAFAKHREPAVAA